MPIGKRCITLYYIINTNTNTSYDSMVCTDLHRVLAGKSVKLEICPKSKRSNKLGSKSIIYLNNTLAHAKEYDQTVDKKVLILDCGQEKF